MLFAMLFVTLAVKVMLVLLVLLVLLLMLLMGKLIVLGRKQHMWW